MKNITRAKVSYTYFLPNHAAALEYLSKHCEDLKTSKVDLLDKALTRLFNRVKPYKDLLNTLEYKEFERKYKKGLVGLKRYENAEKEFEPEEEGEKRKKKIREWYTLKQLYDMKKNLEGIGVSEGLEKAKEKSEEFQKVRVELEKAEANMKSVEEKVREELLSREINKATYEGTHLDYEILKQIISEKEQENLREKRGFGK